MDNQPAITDPQEYSRLVELRREIGKYARMGINCVVSPQLVRMVCAWLDGYIGRENRLKFLAECYGHPVASSSDLTAAEAMGLLAWAAPGKAGETSPWQPGMAFYGDVSLLQRYYGQTVMNVEEA